MHALRLFAEIGLANALQLFDDAGDGLDDGPGFGDDGIIRFA